MKTKQEDSIKQKLKDYQRVKDDKIESLNPGDKLRYFVNGEFRSGGVVKINKFPKYIVLLNPIKNVTWCVQLTSPSLMLYVKPLKKINKERNDMKKIYSMYKEGKLCVTDKK